MPTIDIANELIRQERYRRSLYPDMDDEEFFERLSSAFSRALQTYGEAQGIRRCVEAVEKLHGEGDSQDYCEALEVAVEDLQALLPPNE